MAGHEPCARVAEEIDLDELSRWHHAAHLIGGQVGARVGFEFRVGVGVRVRVVARVSLRLRCSGWDSV